MARTYTRSALRTRIRQLADQVNSRFIDDDELNDWIDVANAEFHEFLYQSGLSYVETDVTASTVAGTSAYNVPADFLGVLKLEWRPSSSEPWRRLLAVNPMEDHRYGIENAEPVGFRTVNGTLVLYPPPVAGTYRLRYVPGATKLASDAATIDGVNGWEQLVVVDCVIKCLLKEESDASSWINERNELRARIKSAAEDRLISDGMRIIDVGERSEGDPADLPRRRVSW